MWSTNSINSVMEVATATLFSRSISPTWIWRPHQCKLRGGCNIDVTLLLGGCILVDNSSKNVSSLVDETLMLVRIVIWSNGSIV
jgi:hypothetical protein